MATVKGKVKEVISAQYGELRENPRFNFQQQDKFLIWLTGFDIVGVSLLISNSDKLNSTYSHSSVKWTTGIMCLSIL